MKSDELKTLHSLPLYSMIFVTISGQTTSVTEYLLISYMPTTSL